MNHREKMSLSSECPAALLSAKLYMKYFLYWTADVKSSELWSSQLWTPFKELSRIWLLAFMNLKMMNESSKRHPELLSMIFTVNCLSKTSVIRMFVYYFSLKTSRKTYHRFPLFPWILNCKFHAFAISKQYYNTNCLCTIGRRCFGWLSISSSLFTFKLRSRYDFKGTS